MFSTSVKSYVAKGGFAITPSATPLIRRAFGIYVGTAGNLTVIDDTGTTLTFMNVSAGATIPIVATHVLASSTASNLIGYRLS